MRWKPAKQKGVCVMLNSERKTLVIIGAGPKGIATAVKAKVLEEFGLPVDRVIVIEKNKVAAHWSGDFGYTNGEMKLGTSPEKDIVFPIETDVGDINLNQRIRQRLLQFTWTSFLVQTERYSDWVDRGRPAPCHLFWAEYIRWVSLQLEPHVQIVNAEVKTIDINSAKTKWELNLISSNGQPSTLHADRLMLTGPGQTRMNFIKGAILPDNTYDLESFWSALKAKQFRAHGRIAIVGAGENAASALLALGQYAPNLRVDVISPKGFISTRAESYYENQMYSQPERNHWAQLEAKDRIDFIERTDLGVFSVHAMTLLNEQLRHQIVPGRVIDLQANDGKLDLTLQYGPNHQTREYDQVILASGFDQIATLKTFFSATALNHVEMAIGAAVNQTNLMHAIQPDLSVQGLSPALHLPMLAGFTQGPGFANLSCLGRLSDRLVTLPATEQSKLRKEKPQRLALLEGSL
jgi:mycobactin lysine-N-oxygenase